ncbi:hypothetical protein P3342_009107 [Pyrenophora teres f. teres]|nr:hypothetical protein P3342_009107 [Pyrenophora teres f. teres]
MIEGIDGKISEIDEVSRFEFDMHGHREVIYAYVLNNMDEEVVLGKGWMDHQDVSIAPAKEPVYTLERHSSEVSASTFIGLIRRSKDPKKRVQIFAASIADINKALAPKKAVDVKSLLPKQYQSYFELFNPKEASKLPPHRGPGVDHKIELESKDGQQPQPPWGPLYRFIRVSSSPASSPVLFAKKPGGGLRLCIDYRALNAITRKDRYPLPLIRETLNNISKAKWFTKLDVIAAFHKIRVAEGDEWKTAFRTRFGLFEWLVTPFSMANSPSTFQRYINWTLREYLDEFCSAYLDDVLIYTDGSLRQHQDHVRKVLSKLQSAGLHVDIKKCEFEVKSTKYLGFIIDAGKVKAIKEWEAPKTVKGVRSFLGFANFYRKFIRDFAKIATPLTRLTGDVSFTWGKDKQAAFDKLKEIFVIEPVLATFDSERDTVLECDSSGYATGGVLSQYDEEGKNNAHECNYEIHDKELLAVVRCLEEWDAELRSVKSFKVITDHKNLEYFMKPKMLSERQIRWAASLSRFNMEILYRPGKQNDLPEDAGDERLQKRIVQILKPTSRCYEEASEDEEDSDKSWVMSARIRVRRTGSCPSLTEEQPDQQDAAANESGTEQSEQVGQTGDSPSPTEGQSEQQEDLAQRNELEELWLEALKNDRQYQEATQAVIGQERRWVPDNESLRTKIISGVHDSLSWSPRREITYKILAREFFWPGMTGSIRRYVRNCDVCGRTKPWREGSQGLLKPLPIPDRIWKEISMDFIEGLPTSEGMTFLMVVTDRLSKGSIFIPLPDIKTETVVRAFLRQVVAYHWLPDAITSDRGSQFVSVLWERLRDPED